MDDARQEIVRELEPGEHLLWSGAPRPGVRFRPADAFLVPFSLVWAGFAVFWEWSALRLPGPGKLMALFGIPFVAMGLHFVAGRFFVDAGARRRTRYGLTDRRAIVVSGILARRVRSVRLGSADPIELVERRDGTGTIRFGPALGFAGWSGHRSAWLGDASWPGMGAGAGVAFEGIDRVRDVHSLVGRARQLAD